MIAVDGLPDAENDRRAGGREIPIRIDRAELSAGRGDFANITSEIFSDHCSSPSSNTALGRSGISPYGPLPPRDGISPCPTASRPRRTEGASFAGRPRLALPPDRERAALTALGGTTGDA